MEKRDAVVCLLALTGFLLHVGVLGQDGDACKTAADAKDCDTFCRMTWGKASLHNIPWTRGGCIKEKCDCVFNEEQLGRYSLPKCPGTTKTWLPLEHQVNLAEAEYQSQLAKMGAREQFKVFKQTWGKTYKTKAEEEKRFKIFANSLETVKELNEQRAERKDTAVFGVTKFSDLTPEEFTKMYMRGTGIPRDPRQKKKGRVDMPDWMKGKPLERKFSKAPSRQISKAPARQSSKSPPRQISKAPARQSSKSPSRQISKAPARQSSKSPSRQISKAPARQSSKSPARDGSKFPRKTRSQNLQARGLGLFRGNTKKDRARSSSPPRGRAAGRSAFEGRSASVGREDEQSCALDPKGNPILKMDDDDNRRRRGRRGRRHSPEPEPEPEPEEPQIPWIIGPDPTGRATVDWRVPARLYPPAESQRVGEKDCGCCWSFACVGTVEILWSHQEGEVVQLAKQDLIDCVQENNGCLGGTIEEGLEYLKKYGVTLEENYPFTAEEGECNVYSRPYVKITGYQTLSRPADPQRGIPPFFAQDFQMEAALQQGPLPVGYPQSPSILQYYVRGVFDPPPWLHDTPTGHAVVMVGHYAQRPHDCWILRNSWGPDWGMEGHFLVQKRTMGIGWNVNKIVGRLEQLFWSEPGSDEPSSTSSDDGAGPSYHDYQPGGYDLPDMSRLNIHDNDNYYYPPDYNNYYHNY